MITKVDKYPEWKQPQLIKILDNVLNDAANETIEKLKEDLTQEYLENGYRSFMKGKKEEKSLTDEVFKDLHANVFCNKCQNGNFFGLRYICAECNNYNLCQNCEKLFFRKQIHNRNHVLIQVNSPLDEDNNILKYNSIISNNNIVEKNDAKIFSYKSNCFNNGLSAWVGCYILPVRYGDEYLTCEPFKIEKPVEKNYDCMINLKIQVPDTNKKYYEGYFRMFTPKGLPFGQLITIKVLRGENN